MANKRPSLSNFVPAGTADAGNVTAIQEALSTPAKAGEKYPKLSVYLNADEIRTLKLIALDSGQRVSDIAATAIREWLERNGHARDKAYKA